MDLISTRRHTLCAAGHAASHGKACSLQSGGKQTRFILSKAYPTVGQQWTLAPFANLKSRKAAALRHGLYFLFTQRTCVHQTGRPSLNVPHGTPSENSHEAAMLGCVLCAVTSFASCGCVGRWVAG